MPHGVSFFTHYLSNMFIKCIQTPADELPRLGADGEACGFLQNFAAFISDDSEARLL